MSTIENDKNVLLPADMDIDDDDDDQSEGSSGSEVFRHQAAASKSNYNKIIAGENKSDYGDDFMNEKGSKSRVGSGVQFGSVRVHTHKMTLGDNPGAKTAGPPVTLDWNVQESERFEDVNGYSMKYHGTRDSQRVIEGKLVHAHRMDAKERMKIAGRDHTAGSIRKLQSELYTIKKHREESANEDPEKVVETKKKKRGIMGGLFGSLFGDLVPKEKQLT